MSRSGYRKQIFWEKEITQNNHIYVLQKKILRVARDFVAALTLDAIEPSLAEGVLMDSILILSVRMWES